MFIQNSIYAFYVKIIMCIPFSSGPNPTKPQLLIAIEKAIEAAIYIRNSPKFECFPQFCCFFFLFRFNFVGCWIGHCYLYCVVHPFDTSPFLLLFTHNENTFFHFCLIFLSFSSFSLFLCSFCSLVLFN